MPPLVNTNQSLRIYSSEMQAPVHAAASNVTPSQWGQASLIAYCRNRSRSWPRGRRVDCRLRRRAIDSSRSSISTGLPRCADNRTAANSAALSGVLTRLNHPGWRCISLGDRGGGVGSEFLISENWRIPAAVAFLAVAIELTYQSAATCRGLLTVNEAIPPARKTTVAEARRP
jgi:hypothetical protein